MGLDSGKKSTKELPSISAFLGLLIFSLLPGIALWKRDRPWLQQVGSCTAISVALNSYVVMLLVLFEIYSWLTAWTWVCLLLVLTLLLRKERGWLRSRIQISGLEGSEETSSLLLLPILFIVACKSFALPFFAWDSIASWNHWARGFALDPRYLSSSQFLHPQYFSWGMSFPYIVSGDPTQETAAHGFAFVSFLIFCGGLWKLAGCFSLPGAVAVTLLTATLGVSSYAGTGYSDIAATGFSCFALALMLEAVCSPGSGDAVRLRLTARNRAILAGLAGGSAFHYKLLAPLGLVTLTLGLLLAGGRRDLRRRLQLSMAAGGATLVVAVPWLISGSSTFSSPLLHYIITGIHGGVSRWQIMKQGAATLAGGLTAFSGSFVDFGVLIVTLIFFVAAFRRSATTAVLGVTALLGTLVWMATANYDTRALLPFQAAGVVVALAGLDYHLRGRASRRTRHAILLSLQTLSLAAYLLPQLAPDLRLQGIPVMDWKPGRHWFRALTKTDREEKLRILRPALADLEEWKRKHPGFTRTIWSDPVLVASYDPRQVDGRACWLGLIESEGRVNWKRGDYLLLTPEEHLARKLPHPVIDGLVGMTSETWGPWITAAVAAGVLREDSEYSNLKSFEIRVDPTP